VARGDATEKKSPAGMRIGARARAERATDFAPSLKVAAST